MWELWCLNNLFKLHLSGVRGRSCGRGYQHTKVYRMITLHLYIYHFTKGARAFLTLYCPLFRGIRDNVAEHCDTSFYWAYPKWAMGSSRRTGRWMSGHREQGYVLRMPVVYCTSKEFCSFVQSDGGLSCYFVVFCKPHN